MHQKVKKREEKNDVVLCKNIVQSTMSCRRRELERQRRAAVQQAKSKAHSVIGDRRLMLHLTLKIQMINYCNAMQFSTRLTPLIRTRGELGFPAAWQVVLGCAFLLRGRVTVQKTIYRTINLRDSMQLSAVWRHIHRVGRHYPVGSRRNIPRDVPRGPMGTVGSYGISRGNPGKNTITFP